MSAYLTRIKLLPQQTANHTSELSLIWSSAPEHRWRGSESIASFLDRAPMDASRIFARRPRWRADGESLGVSAPWLFQDRDRLWLQLNARGWIEFSRIQGSSGLIQAARCASE